MILYGVSAVMLLAGSGSGVTAIFVIGILALLGTITLQIATRPTVEQLRLRAETLRLKAAVEQSERDVVQAKMDFLDAKIAHERQLLRSEQMARSEAPKVGPPDVPDIEVRERYRKFPRDQGIEMEIRARYYDEERARAARAGKTVKQLRAGILNIEETKAALDALLASGETMPAFRVVRGGSGLAVALPDGRGVDPKSIHLRHWDIYGSRIVGRSHYKAGQVERGDGQMLKLKREPENDHDANAIAVMTSSGASKIGYIAKGQAKRVAKAMDGGLDLVAHTMMNGSQVLVTTPEMWDEMQR
ncbi:HIRAN domain-containing protein [Jonesiaceae bacterium BS-20]|uniref:HIRAN domain-containing protein n=1 Tax=Jonesiaceae bacterium BS-20 TaxID=3120821 RepID=A0AAU7DYR0_9MICO